MNVAVKEEGEQVVFLRKVLPGRADRSYGIYVAKLAGLPAEIIGRSEEILKYLESASGTKSQVAAASDNGRKTGGETESEVIKELRRLDILSMTPLEAINKLYLLQKRINGDSMQ
jgi:DNA mismatch repair protein MutS